MGKTTKAPPKHATRRPLRTKVEAPHCTHCEKKSKTKQHLKKHLADVHDIDVTWHPCTHCEKKFKQQSNLKTHLANVHDIDVTWHPCTHCKEKFKEAGTLKTHLANVHDIGVKWHPCTCCEQKFKQACNLKTHLAYVHDIGVTWHPCTHCKEKFKEAGHLKTHLADVHDIGVKWHPCTCCEQKFKQACNLKTHLENVHDIGRHKCTYCFQNRNSSIPYDDAGLGGQVRICRKCFNKKTGKESRIELQWSQHLDEQLGTLPYLQGSDKSLRSMGGCSLKRPDKTYLYPEFWLLGECDERQHAGHNGNYSCEEQRLSEIYDEESICGQKMVVLRWNPDQYTPPAGHAKVRSRQERLAIYVALHRWLRAHPPAELISVYYLFYNEDNPRICRQYPVRMISSMADVEAL